MSERESFEARQRRQLAEALKEAGDVAAESFKRFGEIMDGLREETELMSRHTETLNEAFRRASDQSGNHLRRVK